MSGPLVPPNSQSKALDDQGRFTNFWFNFFNQINQLLNPTFGSVATLQADVTIIQAQIAAGQSVTITTAKLTALGSNGSMTFVNGILTAHVDPT